MTNDRPKKMQSISLIFARVCVWCAGGVEALLLVRLLARLLAARPDNPAFAVLYLATGPLVAPLAALDQGQRRFGAVLEFSTLSIAILVPAIMYLLWIWLATCSPRRAS